MKDLNPPLILESDQKSAWKETQIGAYIDRDNIKQVSICNVIKSVESQTHHNISFTLTTKAYIPVRICIPVFSAANGKVILSIDGNKIKTFDLRATDTKTPEITLIEREISRSTEKVQQTKIKLQFVLEEEEKVSIILNSSEPGLVPGMIQKWNFSYFAKAVLFFVFINALILGVGGLVAAHLRTVNASLQFYLVLITAAGWLLGVLGITDLLKIPFQQKIRALYSKTFQKRTRWLIALGTLCLIVYIGVGFVAYSMWRRQTYTNLVRQAINNPDNNEFPIKAFKMMPWRREAQLLIEGRMFVARNRDMKVYRNIVREFVDDVEVKEAIEKASDNKSAPLYLIQDEDTLDIPAVWFAGLTGERDEEGESAMNESIERLSKYKDKYSTIQRLALELSNLAGKLNDKSDNQPTLRQIRQNADILEEIVNEIEQSSNTKMLHSFYYQLACDTIAVSYINLCVYKHKQDECLSKITSYFQKEITARKNALKNKNKPIWFRPPEKLVLYYLFTLDKNPNKGGISTPGEEEATKAKEFIVYCYCQTEDKASWSDEKCYEESMKNQVIDQFGDFQDPKAWLEGTSTIENVKNEIEKSIETGWRY
jgi:hypothetical protein